MAHDWSARGNAPDNASATPWPSEEQMMQIGAVPARLVPLFVFLHIPKTAGSSLRCVLRQMFTPFYHFYQSNEELEKTEENVKSWADPGYYNRYLLIGGHVARAHPLVAAPHLTRRIIYVSVFRDPVERAISWYDFIRRWQNGFGTGHPWREMLKDMTLYEALTTQNAFRQRCIHEQLRYVFATTDPRQAEIELHRENYLLAPMSGLEWLIDTLSAVSGLDRPSRLPKMNVSATATATATTAEPAHAQDDYDRAVDLLTETNAQESEFIRQHIRDGVLTTNVRPMNDRS